MSIRRAIAAGAVVVATVGLGLIAAAPASAATSNCPSGATCTWNSIDYTTDGVDGALLGFQISVDNYVWYSYVGTSVNANDSATSIYNNGNVSTVQMYVDPSYSGPSFTLAKKLGDGNLGNFAGNVPSGFNNLISSGKFI